jgi:hypothetical protein
MRLQRFSPSCPDAQHVTQALDQLRSPCLDSGERFGGAAGPYDIWRFPEHPRHGTPDDCSEAAC